MHLCERCTALKAAHTRPAGRAPGGASAGPHLAPVPSSPSRFWLPRKVTCSTRWAMPCSRSPSSTAHRWSAAAGRQRRRRQSKGPSVKLPTTQRHAPPRSTGRSSKAAHTHAAARRALRHRRSHTHNQACTCTIGHTGAHLTPRAPPGAPRSAPAASDWAAARSAGRWAGCLAPAPSSAPAACPAAPRRGRPRRRCCRRSPSVMGWWRWQCRRQACGRGPGRGQGWDPTGGCHRASAMQGGQPPTHQGCGDDDLAAALAARGDDHPGAAQRAAGGAQVAVATFDGRRWRRRAAAAAAAIMVMWQSK